MWIRERMLFICISLIIVTLLLAGCLKGEQTKENEEDPSNNQIEENEDWESLNDEVDNDEQEKHSGTVEREIYLIDANGFVVSQTFQLPVPESKEVATQVLEYLVKDGPITEILPNGFRAVLPEDTEVLSVNLQEDGTIIIDFSNEFANYQSEDERKILEAITFTVTQFDSIDQVHLRMEGKELTEMPVNGTPIEGGYSREKGINVTQSDTIDFLASDAVTMYYPTENDSERYYVPITQYIRFDEESMFRQIIEALMIGPGYDTNVMHVFHEDIILVEEPELQDGVLELVFNDMILKDTEQNIVSDEIMETLTRTLTEEKTVEAIRVKVENSDVILNEAGEQYSEPVTKEYFMSKDHM